MDRSLSGQSDLIWSWWTVTQWSIRLDLGLVDSHSLVSQTWFGVGGQVTQWSVRLDLGLVDSHSVVSQT